MPKGQVRIFQLERKKSATEDFNLGNSGGVKRCRKWERRKNLLCFYLKLCLGGRGSGGGTSSRAMAFCKNRPGSNPGTDIGFLQFRIAVNPFSLGFGLCLITCNRTVHTLSSSFLFPIIIYHCNLTIYQEKEKINPKRSWERPIFKKMVSGRDCTEVALALLTQMPRIRIPALQRFFSA